MVELNDRRRASSATTDALLRQVLARLERIEAALAGRQSKKIKQGRPPIDDADALAEIADLMSRGIGRADAIGRVAEALGGNIDAHHQRLGRKLPE